MKNIRQSYKERTSNFNTITSKTQKHLGLTYKNFTINREQKKNYVIYSSKYNNNKVNKKLILKERDDKRWDLLSKKTKNRTIHNV